MSRGNSAPPFPSSRSFVERYKDGSYLEKNPTWHVEESPFKVKYILQLLRRNSLDARSVCEAGCGAGEVLRLLQAEMPPGTEFTGFDISPQAHALSVTRENEHLHFVLADITQEAGLHFDLLLVLDVIEHLEDYFSFLRAIRNISKHTVFHFPLDLSGQVVMRKDGLLKRRRVHEHIHYFSRETVLATLSDTGYHVVDCLFTPRANEIGGTFAQKVLRLPRAILFAMHQEFAVRSLGGYSLMVLSE